MICREFAVPTISVATRQQADEPGGILRGRNGCRRRWSKSDVPGDFLKSVGCYVFDGGGGKRSGKSGGGFEC
jgi:hypothetical protein